MTLRARAASPEQEPALLATFNAAREAEYAEVTRECKKFLAHIEREAAEEEYEFTELEELEEDLEKIERWLVQVSERDVFGILARTDTAQLAQHCHELLALFAQETYQRTGAVAEDKEEPQ